MKRKLEEQIVQLLQIRNWSPLTNSKGNLVKVLQKMYNRSPLALQQPPIPTPTNYLLKRIQRTGGGLGGTPLWIGVRRFPLSPLLSSAPTREDLLHTKLSRVREVKEGCAATSTYNHRGISSYFGERS